MPYELSTLGPKEILSNHIVPYFLTGVVGGQPGSNSSLGRFDPDVSAADRGKQVLQDLFRSVDFKTCPREELHRLTQQYLQREFEDHIANRGMLSIRSTKQDMLLIQYDFSIFPLCHCD